MTTRERNREKFEEWMRGREEERVHLCRDMTFAGVCRKIITKCIDEDIRDFKKFYSFVKKVTNSAVECYYEDMWEESGLPWDYFEAMVPGVVALVLIDEFGVKGNPNGVVLTGKTHDGVMKRLNKKEYE